MTLEQIRNEINKIDEKIVELLKKRFSLALRTKKWKKKFRDKKRESEILQKIKSPYLRDVYKSIFKNVHLKEKALREKKKKTV
jgi:shikimate dehydrogenase